MNMFCLFLLFVSFRPHYQAEFYYTEIGLLHLKHSVLTYYTTPILANCREYRPNNKKERNRKHVPCFYRVLV